VVWEGLSEEGPEEKRRNPPRKEVKGVPGRGRIAFQQTQRP
jgi:hypothetical protein